jgi:hypothetical protein
MKLAVMRAELKLSVDHEEDQPSFWAVCNETGNSSNLIWLRRTQSSFPIILCAD